MLDQDIIIPIIVGAFSGALGAIAAPVISHYLEGSRLAGERQEKRQRKLKDMVKVRIQFSQIVVATGYRMIAVQSLGNDIGDVWIDHQLRLSAFSESLKKHPGGFGWYPEEINDSDLRELVTRMTTSEDRLSLTLAGRTTIQGESEIASWPREAGDQLDELNALITAVDRRVFKLDW